MGSRRAWKKILRKLCQVFFGTAARSRTEMSVEFCCFPGWSWLNGYITAVFRAQFAAERIMPDYAQNLQNPDYAPNYAIMPGHNGEDPTRVRSRTSRLELPTDDRGRAEQRAMVTR